MSKSTVATFASQEAAGQEAADAANTMDQPDTSSGIPDDAMDLEAGDDGALATTDTDDEELDTDDGTPDDEDSDDEGGFEQRYKDTQSKLTETSQALADLKAEYAEQVGEITQAKFDIEEQTQSVEEVAQFWATAAQGDLQRLQNVNVQQLSQEQYQQWQQQLSTAQARAGQFQQALEQTQARAKQAKEAATQKAVAIARARLDKVINDFPQVYPKIGEYAVSRGVNPEVFKGITDPGLIEILHEAMQASSASDSIEVVQTKKQAQRKAAKQNARQRAQRQPKSLAQKMYGNN